MCVSSIFASRTLWYSLSLSSVCATRLMLNIRHVRKDDINGSSSASATFGENIQFTSALVEPQPSFLSAELVEDGLHESRWNDGASCTTTKVSAQALRNTLRSGTITTRRISRDSIRPLIWQKILWCSLCGTTRRVTRGSSFYAWLHSKFTICANCSPSIIR
jgi:hypothetical protein